MSSQTSDPLDVFAARVSPEARQLMRLIHRCSQLADDFVDGAGYSDCRSKLMVELLVLAGVLIPNDPFFRRFRQPLEAAFITAALTWDASNDWERSRDENTRMFGYVYREAVAQVFALIAFLDGGIEVARAVFREVHTFYHSPGRVEPFRDWEVQHGRQ